MNKTKYNQLREEIIKANEDIVDLKFGCKVKFGEGVYVISNQKGECDYCVNTCEIGEVEKSRIKIIGRDITLFDIKQFLIYNGYTTKEFCKIAELWEEPNSLDGQSNKLKEKLYEYIKNKNG